MVSVRGRWIMGAALAAAVIVGGFGAARILAQQPVAVPGATGIEAPGTSISVPTVRDPARKIPFSMAPHGPVSRITKTTPGGGRVSYYRFTSSTDRTYIVELPVEMTKEERSRDAWITLFSVYGRDPAAEATNRALMGSAMATGATDRWALWNAMRVSEQIMRVSTAKAPLAKLTQSMALWSSIHQEAKYQNDQVKARTAWQHIAEDKADLNVTLRKLAAEKLQLGKIYKDAGMLEPARQQFRETASLLIAPYSREAIVKLRVMEGETYNPTLYTNAGLVGIERTGMSQIYQAGVRAQSTTP